MPALRTSGRGGGAIEAHLTVVFAALAVARELQAATGVSLKKLVQTLRPLRVPRQADGRFWGSGKLGIFGSA